jgi:triacylglycerol lipase
MTGVLLVTALGGVLIWLTASWARWRWSLGREAAVGPWAVLRMLGEETTAVLTLATYYARGLGRSGLRSPRESRGRPVLCVHGFTQNGTNFWGLRRACEARGLATLAVNLGLPFRSVERYVPRLVRSMEAALADSEQLDVVCHSMGGVVLRAALATRPDLAPRLRTIVTLGSPHRGTLYARGFEWFSADTRELAFGSQLLDRLPTLAHLAPAARVVTISAGWDLIVYPTSSCHAQGGTEVTLPATGHCGLLTSGRARRAVLEALTAPAATG